MAGEPGSSSAFSGMVGGDGSAVLASLLTHSLDAVVVTDRDFTVTGYADSAERLYGWSRKDVLGRRWFAAIPTTITSAAIDDVMELLRDEHPVCVEAQFQRPGGDSLDAQISATPLRDGEGRLTGWLGIGRHITAHHKVNERARDVAARLESVLDASNDGVWECYLPTGACEFNRRWAEMLGYELSDIEPSIAGWERLVHPDDLPGAWKQVQAHLDGESDAFQFECRMRHRDGHWIWVWDRGRIVERDPTGAPIRTAGTHTDITERRTAAAHLQAREEELRSTIAAMAEGVIFQAADGRILHCNAAAERILGLTRAQMEGRTAMESRRRTVHEDGSDFPWETHPAMEALRGGCPVKNVVMGVHRPEGDLAWILINAEPLRHGETEPPYAVVTTFADMTAYREAQQQLLRSQERYRLLFQNLHEAVNVYRVVRDERGHTHDWVLVEANGAATSQMGERTPPVGSRMVETFGDPFKPFIAESDLVLAGRSEPAEVYFAPLDRWYHACSFGLDSDTIVSVSMDITERKAAERKLRESEAQFRVVVEEAAEAIGLVDLRTGTCVLENQRHLDLTGLTREESRQMTEGEFHDRVHPDDLHAVEAQQRRLLDGDASAGPVEFRWRITGGEYRWFRAARTLIRDEAGRPVAVLAFVDDITERRRVEEALRAEIAQRSAQIRDLRETVATKTLDDFLPTCMFCKNIRDASGKWEKLETYITHHTGSLFSHGLCPDCEARFLDERGLRDNSSS